MTTLKACIKLALVGLFSVSSAWLSIAIGISGAMRQRAPEIALDWWPWDARAKAVLVARELSSGRQGAPQPRNMAVEALQRDPSLPDVFLALAITEVNPAISSALVDHSDIISRRHLPTRLFLIERDVRRNDVVSTLRNYDIALRTSRNAPRVLFPVLAAAISDRPLLPYLAAALGSESNWRRDFLLYAVPNSRSPEHLAILSNLASRSGHPFGSDIDRLLISRLVANNQFEAAFGIFQRITPRSDQIAPVRNGNFESNSPGSSFDWVLTDEADLWARRVPDGRGGIALEFGTASGRSGRVAQQVLMLPAGVYSLRYESWSGENGRDIRPEISIACAGTGSAPFRGAIAMTPARTVTRVGFAIPAGCVAQFLSISVGGHRGLTDGWGRIDSIDVSAAPAARTAR